MRIFRSGTEESHFAMTGSKRLATAPFLQVSVIALQLLTTPDNDLLLQAALAVNDFRIRLRGVNMFENDKACSDQSVNKLQEVAFRKGLYMYNTLITPINTKAHRLMSHIRHHVFRNGEERILNSDRKEAMHKETKQAYGSTNNQSIQLAPKLLSARTIALQNLFLSQKSQEKNATEDSFCFMMRCTVYFLILMKLKWNLHL